jgi:endonuclease-8
MPEGPEIRREADRIERALAGRPVEAVWFAFEHLRANGDDLAGHRLDRVETRGKALLLRFDCGVNIYSHNQLYGRWYVTARGRTPRTGRQLRLAIHGRLRSALLYSASEIDVLHDEQLADHPFLSRLGPDVLQAATTEASLLDRLSSRRFRGRSLGTLLLDQGFVCGLGNYLRSEILFVTGLRAEQRPRDLDTARLEQLAAAVLELARRAYRLRGVTNDPDDARRLQADGVPRRDYRHFVFARAGRPCRACGSSIEHSTHGSRRLYTCPVCQPSVATTSGASR